MKGTSFIVVGILLCGVFASSAFADPCEALLAEGLAFSHAEGTSHPSPREGSLITYLSLLLEQNLIGDEHLVRLAEGLGRGEIVNPISDVEAQTNPSLMIHRDGLKRMLSETLDQEALLTWVREKLSQRKIVQVQREVVHQETKIPFQPMEFVVIHPGSFTMGRFLVTQWQYAIITGHNPSHFANGPETIEIKIAGQKIRMQPNHPVENVSWNDIHKLFLPKLNALSKADDSLIYEVILGHIPGKIYRLSENAEWERVARAQTDAVYSFRNDENELPKHAWFNQNSNGSTHAVGLKLPNPWGLYDMHGNVWELMKDPSGSYRVIRGGGWDEDAPRLLSANRLHGGANGRHANVGFRLVRADE